MIEWTLWRLLNLLLSCIYSLKMYNFSSRVILKILQMKRYHDNVWPFAHKTFGCENCLSLLISKAPYFARKTSMRGYRKKINLLKISHFPDFSQRFPDFSLTKFFKVRKCGRCGSLNPRLTELSLINSSIQRRRQQLIDKFQLFVSQGSQGFIDNRSCVSQGKKARTLINNIQFNNRTGETILGKHLPLNKYF